MCRYAHLTPFEREKILFFLAVGNSITKIARLPGRNKSIISRELCRNTAPAKHSMPYQPLAAQARYKQRRAACRPHKRLENASLRSFVQICILEYHWSPEEIVGRIQLKHGRSIISVPTIYRAAHAGMHPPERQRSSFSEGCVITGSVATGKGWKNIAEGSSYLIPSRNVLSALRSELSAAIGKQIPWSASKEEHASSHWWTARAAICLDGKQRARPLLRSTR